MAARPRRGGATDGYPIAPGAFLTEKKTSCSLGLMARQNSIRSGRLMTPRANISAPGLSAARAARARSSNAQSQTARRASFGYADLSFIVFMPSILSHPRHFDKSIGVPHPLGNSPLRSTPAAYRVITFRRATSSMPLWRFGYSGFNCKDFS